MAQVIRPQPSGGRPRPPRNPFAALSGAELDYACEQAVLTIRRYINAWRIRNHLPPHPYPLDEYPLDRPKGTR